MTILPITSRPGISSSPPGAAPGLTEFQPLVLVVGSNAAEREQSAQLFRKKGFRTREADSPHEADRVMQTEPVELVLLESRIDQGGGLGLCQRLAWNYAAPIILLAEEADVTDRVIALEVGADDLIGRPFDDRELLARARALLRRSRREPVTRPAPGSQDGVLYGNTRVLVGPQGVRVPLPPTQYLLLRIFAACPGRLVTAAAALESLGSSNFSNNQLRTSVLRLRRRLAQAGFDPNCVASVRSEGYVLEDGVRIRVTDEDIWSGSAGGRRSAPAPAH